MKALPTRYALFLSLLAFGCQKKASESQEKGWFQGKEAQTDATGGGSDTTAAQAEQKEATTDLKGCSPEALARTTLGPLKDIGDQITWRVDLCVPTDGGLQGAIFKELRVTLNLLTPTKFSFLGNAYANVSDGVGEIALPEQVVEINILGGALEFAGLQKVYIVGAPTLSLDISAGSVCRLGVADARLGLTGVRVTENKDVSPNVLQKAEGLFLGNHFVGNKVRALIAKGLNEKLQSLKPVIGCSTP